MDIGRSKYVQVTFLLLQISIQMAVCANNLKDGMFGNAILEETAD